MRAKPVPKRVTLEGLPFHRGAVDSAAASLRFQRMHFPGHLVSTSGPITCTWCGTRYPRHQRNCTNCGGPLPGPTPPDPGPEPLRPPREIPAAYVRRLYLTGNVPSIIGGVFTAVGVGVTVPMVWMARFLGPEVAVAGITGPIFAIVGGLLLMVGIRRAQSQLHALRDGVATRGEIVDLHQDTSESINGRHPWAVVYAYEAGGRMHEGKVKSWGRAGSVVALYAVGSPVHVLYVRERPERSALYPPIR